MKKKCIILEIVFFVLYLSTFLPNFGYFNDLVFIGPFPEPMAFVLIINMINTFIIFLLFKYFYPLFCKAAEKEIEKSKEGNL